MKNLQDFLEVHLLFFYNMVGEVGTLVGLDGKLVRIVQKLVYLSFPTIPIIKALVQKKWGKEA